MPIDASKVQWDSPRIDPGAVQWDAPNVTDDMGTLDRLRAGAGSGMVRGFRALQQASADIGKMIPGGNAVYQAMTGRSLDQAKRQITDDLAESKRLDRPLMDTTAGKVGNVAGGAAIALPAMLVPGANTYLGAALVGGATGGLLTDGDLAERGRGALFGAGGGLLGKGFGDLIGAGARTLLAGRSAAATANVGREGAARAAQDAGYVLPPADVRPTLLNEALNGFSGKIKTAQAASAKNQPVTNDLVKRGVGLAADEQASVAGLNAIRQEAGKAYEAVSSTGTITPGKAYTDRLDSIVAPYLQAAKGFPNAKPSPVIAEIDALRSQSFDAASAVAKIRELRASADSAYAAGNKDVGKALKSGAEALESAIDDHLTAIGAPADLLKNFREARTTIAKTYTAQKALNDVTGNFDASVLAKQLQKGKPLSGELRQVAEAASAFPKATQALKETPKAFSPLDYFAAGSLGLSTSPVAAAAVAARPAIRAGLLSTPYQRGLLKEGGGLTQKLLENAQSEQARQGLLYLSLVNGLQLGEQ